MLKGKKIILGVTGSIAVYKAAFLVRLLVKEGAEVRVISTEGSQRFVSDLTFSTLSANPVFSQLWEGEWTEHVQLGNWGDVLLVAPATANTLAKFASGLVDNALTAVHLAATCPLMIAPAMDADMFRHPATQANISTLRERGAHLISSPEGEHASGLLGPGRMAEPEAIVEALHQFFGEGPLHGKKVLVSAGPTRESLDPVRFLSNPSTGTMGYEIAKRARDLGATVTLVSGPTAKAAPAGMERIDVKSAADMYEAMHAHFPESDITIMSAAVADYTPETKSDQKIKKKDGDMVIRMERTQDILRSLGSAKKTGQILIGFALETQNALENAQRKLKSKQLNLIVLNTLEDGGAGFGEKTNKITILDNNGGQFRYELKSKAETARDIVEKIIEYSNA